MSTPTSRRVAPPPPASWTRAEEVREELVERRAWQDGKLGKVRAKTGPVEEQISAALPVDNSRNSRCASSKRSKASGKEQDIVEKRTRRGFF